MPAQTTAAPSGRCQRYRMLIAAFALLVLASFISSPPGVVNDSSEYGGMSTSPNSLLGIVV
jgi:hypothetical protein